MPAEEDVRWCSSGLSGVIVPCSMLLSAPISSATASGGSCPGLPNAPQSAPTPPALRSSSSCPSSASSSSSMGWRSFWLDRQNSICVGEGRQGRGKRACGEGTPSYWNSQLRPQWFAAVPRCQIGAKVSVVLAPLRLFPATHLVFERAVAVLCDLQVRRAARGPREEGPQRGLLAWRAHRQLAWGCDRRRRDGPGWRHLTPPTAAGTVRACCSDVIAARTCECSRA